MPGSAPDSRPHLSPRCLGNILIPSDCLGFGLLPSFQLLFFYILGPDLIWPADLISEPSWCIQQWNIVESVTSLITSLPFAKYCIILIWCFNLMVCICATGFYCLSLSLFLTVQKSAQDCPQSLLTFSGRLCFFIRVIFFLECLYLTNAEPSPHPLFLVFLPCYVLVVCWPLDVRQIVR